MKTLSGAVMAVVVAALGCGVPNVEAPEGPDELGTVGSELTVKSGTFSATIGTYPVVAPNGDVLFVGSASRNVTDAFAFVPDDAFGTATANKRVLTLTLAQGHEANTLLSGLPVLVRLTTQSGTPNTYFVRVSAQARVHTSSGSTLIKPSGAVPAVYVKDPVNPLRYRLSLEGPALATQVSMQIGNASVAATRVGTSTQWFIDLTYPQLDEAMRSLVTVTAVAPTRSYSKLLLLGVKTIGLDITTADPYDTWPSTTCGAQVYACVSGEPADLGACGGYREVSRCVQQFECAKGVKLTATTDASVQAAGAAFNASATSGGQWGHVNTVRTFDVSSCSPITLEGIVGVLAQEQGAVPFSDGFVVNIVTGHSPFFNTTYSSAGPALLDAANAYGQATNPQAWSSTTETPCHNCHEWQDRVVLSYPALGRLVVIDGVHGWDS